MSRRKVRAKVEPRRRQLTVVPIDECELQLTMPVTLVKQLVIELRSGKLRIFEELRTNVKRR